MPSEDFDFRNNRKNQSSAKKLLRLFRNLFVILAAVCALLLCLHPLRGGTTGELPVDPPAAAAPTLPPAPSVPPETVPAETQPAETAPPETQPEPISEIARATILAAGDIMTHIPIIYAADVGRGYDFSPMFRYIAPYAGDADFAVANLETTLAGTANGDAYSGFPRFNCPDALVDGLKSAGFDMLLTANNHSYDTGTYGMKRTAEVISEKQMLCLGTTADPDAQDFLVQEINGIRIGMVCYTYGQIDGETGQKSVNGLPISTSMTDCIHVFDYERLELFYREMEDLLAGMQQQGAEATVVFIHWGNEYQLERNWYQATIAQKLCDLGVDVIVGGHPHVVQSVELLTSETDPAHRTLCAYSLGNTLSNQRADKMDLDTGHTEDGMLLQFTFVKYSDGRVYLDRVQALPTWVHVKYGTSSRTYTVFPLDENLADWKSEFGIGSTTAHAMEASYARTMAQIRDGMHAVSRELEDLRYTRDQSYGIFRGGVG